MKRAQTMIMTAVFAALIAAGAFMKIPVPYVPITLQTLFVMLAGMLLGAKRGALSVLIYILIGLAGVPVFTNGGGIAYVLQPTFGYIIGFAIGAFVTGIIAHTVENPSFLRLTAGGLAGLAIIYAIGVLYFWLIGTFYTGSAVSAKTLFVSCFLLTVPGDIILCFLASFLSGKLLPVLRKQGYLQS